MNLDRHSAVLRVIMQTPNHPNDASATNARTHVTVGLTGTPGMPLALPHDTLPLRLRPVAVALSVFVLGALLVAGLLLT